MAVSEAGAAGDCSLPFVVRSSLSCCVFCQRLNRSKTLSHLPLSAPLIQSTLKTLLLRAYRIVRKGGNDLLGIVPRKNVLLTYEHTLQIFDHNPPDVSFTFVGHVYCSIWLGLWCNVHASRHFCLGEWNLTSSGNWFPLLWKSLDEAKWTNLAITQNFIKTVDWFLHLQWN